jgi:hypothetical protein
MYYFDGFKSSIKEIKTDFVETAGELKLDVRLEDLIELLKYYDKTLMDEDLLLMVS